jgi:hypothetical protein
MQQRPPLTRLEVAAALRSRVRRLEARGLSRSVAIEAVAEEHGIDPEWVAALVDSVEGFAGGEA